MFILRLYNNINDVGYAGCMKYIDNYIISECLLKIKILIIYSIMVEKGDQSNVYINYHPVIWLIQNPR